MLLCMHACRIRTSDIVLVPSVLIFIMLKFVIHQYMKSSRVMLLYSVMCNEIFLHPKSTLQNNCARLTQCWYFVSNMVAQTSVIKIVMVTGKVQ